MAIEIITKEDLEQFRLRLLDDIKELISKQDTAEPKKWLRSHEVKALLKISTGTLQNLAISGQLKPAKIGGINFYRYEELECLLNARSNLKLP
ncbi:MAG TPA: helix-turn-helix domain-containing protein [Chitinophagaceae bacterium]|nr:helix-turn-helix domain-containing protein [Chitinophagaceae bacterium]